MKHTFWGRTGRAQLTVVDLTADNVPFRQRKPAPEFHVRLLPRSANRSTAYSTAGDLAYTGSDLSTALMHIQAWTGVEEFSLPAGLRKYLQQMGQAQ